MSTKIYPIGVQNFEKIRKEGYFYVDKTAMVYKLAKTGQYCFLSRPRRFGKSLLISTLEAYFQGKKELFAGLAIEHLETEWKQHPVLHLDLNAERYDRLENLNSLLNDSLCRWESVYGHSPSETTLSLRFKGVIRRASEQAGCPVAILIDEYDKPLLQTIGNETLQSEFRDALKAFYGVLKSVDRYICFALLTGVTKFSKVSVFSDLNNLRDISMSRLFDSICGITREELFSSLSAEIRELGATNDMTEEETRNSLQVWYDGYHFSEVGVDIYNPFSLLNTFAEMRFGSYWFETGTPTFLVELLKNGRYDLQRLTQETVSSDSLSGIDSMRDNPVPILYQSGYLTIKGYDAEFKLYHLGFPNREVEDGFTRFILPFYTAVKQQETTAVIAALVQDVRKGDVHSFMHRLQSFFADTPYELVRDLELHYQNVLFIVFKLLGLYTQAEYHTSQGRIDLLLKTDKYIYIIEMKLNGSAEDALKQIHEKQYALPFAADVRTVFKIGVNFSNETRNIERWLVEV